MYQNALTKYKELLDKGEVTKKNYFEQRAREKRFARPEDPPGLEPVVELAGWDRRCVLEAAGFRRGEGNAEWRESHA